MGVIYLFSAVDLDSDAIDGLYLPSVQEQNKEIKINPVSVLWSHVFFFFCQYSFLITIEQKYLFEAEKTDCTDKLQICSATKDHFNSTISAYFFGGGLWSGALS